MHRFVNNRISQDVVASKRGAHNQPTTFPHLPYPQLVSFCGHYTVGDPVPFEALGGGEPDLHGWGGVLYCVTVLNFTALRSDDGATIYLHQRWTGARWEGQA